MKEFMFYIRNEKDAKKSLSEDRHLEFIRKCESYIADLKAQNKLIAAQPIVREELVLKREGEGWSERNVQTDMETQVGYYRIRAENLEEAIRIAKNNSEFEFVPSASIEVRPVKIKEIETGFIYPSGNEKA